MDETDRRREKQVAYNTANGITPESVKKNISDVMHSVFERADYMEVSRGVAGLSDVDQAAFESPAHFQKHIKALDDKMKKAASNLEFEEAAKLRDQIKKLKALDLGLSAENPLARKVEQG